MTTDTSKASCHLVSGWFALGVQALLAFLCVLTLVIKRFQETPQRPWLIWFLDTSKQGVSSSMGHMSNILVSIIIASSIGNDKNADECQWYSMAYVSDTIFGTCFNFLLIILFERTISILAPSIAEYMKFGVYGDPPDVCKRWLPQLIIWLVIVAMSKCFVLSVLYMFVYPLNSAGKVLFAPLRPYPRVELITVMILIPMCLNSVQFWVTDTFLKKGNRNSDADTDDMMELPTDSSHSDMDEELISSPRQVSHRSIQQM